MGHWEKKEDLQRKKEIDAAMNASKEQKETRSVLNDIFKKVDDGKGIEEDELIEKIKQKLNRTKKTVSALSQNAQNKLTESANGIILAMKSGFLAEDYSVELDNTYGTRTYFQKKEESEEYEAVANGDEMSDLIDKFAAHSGSTFALSVVKGVDEKKIDQLCSELKSNVYDDLFIVTQEKAS